MGLSHISICQTDFACVYVFSNRLPACNPILVTQLIPFKKKERNMLTLKWPVQPHWWQSALLHSSSQSTLDNAVKEKELQIHKGPTSHIFVLTMTLNAELEMLWRQTPGKNLDLLSYSTFLPLKTLLRHNREYISLTHTLKHWWHFHKKKLEIWPVNIWLQVDPFISELQPPTRCLLFSNLV